MSIDQTLRLLAKARGLSVTDLATAIPRAGAATVSAWMRGEKLPGKDQLDAGDLSLECLRLVYRLLFMFYIEARPELGYVPIGIFMGFVLGSLVGVALMVGRGADRRTALPFGPFLAAGALLTIAAGPSFVDALWAF